MISDHVQTKREIRALLQAAGTGPKKRFGQHFLIDGNLMRRLAESAELSASDLVLEIGGGTGGLTDLLAARAGEVVCVELDRDLCAILEARFRDAPQVRLVPGDVLESKHRLAPAIVEALRAGPRRDGGRIMLVANLPYQVATPLLMNLLVDFPHVRRMVFTVQTEVGQRITAPPGCKAYGALSILAQMLCQVQVVARVPAEAFWPAPAVSSVMVRMDVASSPLAGCDEVRAFAGLVRAAFDHRRKVLRSALGYVVGAPAVGRLENLIDLSRRPETLDIQEWLRVFRTVSAGGGGT